MDDPPRRPKTLLNGSSSFKFVHYEVVCCLASIILYLFLLSEFSRVLQVSVAEHAGLSQTWASETMKTARCSSNNVAPDKRLSYMYMVTMLDEQSKYGNVYLDELHVS